MKIINFADERSLVNVFMRELRDEKIQKDMLRFRRNIERIGEIAAYEISKTLEFKTIDTKTCLGTAKSHVVDETVVIATILRAGLPLHQGVHNYFDGAENAFVSAYRKYVSKDDFRIHIEYIAAPRIDDKVLIITDPMLATGSSMELAYEALLTKGKPSKVHIVSVIASQQAITASPISAATVALLGLLTGFDITLFDILKITIPATLIGVLVGAFLSKKVGKELLEDPEYLRRLEAGMIDTKHVELNDVKNMFHARISVIIFIAATLLIVLFGSIPAMRPVFNGAALDMPSIIEILMLCAAAIILIISRTDGIKATQGSVFPAGMQAVIAIFGIAWMGDTFINGNITELTGSIEGIVRQMPWLFGLALFVMSILLYSQAATVRAIVPLGIALGISPMMLIALFPAVNGYFFIPNYPTVVAAINFDRTGTTGIGKWILNHSFMMPGMVATLVSIVVGLLLIQVF